MADVRRHDWQPYPREWINADSPIVEDQAFTIMTYNILCDVVALHNPGYKYVRDGFLKMEDRHPLIVAEVKQRCPDVLCLQEVENNNLSERLIPDLKREGYVCASDHTGYKEGPATFYRPERFSLEWFARRVAHDAFMELLQDSNSLSDEITAAVREYLERPKEFILTKLKCKKSGWLVTVANIHTTWEDLEWPTVQTAQVCAGLRKLLELSGGSDSCYVYTGDFNSLPSCPPYCFLRDGRLSPEVLAKYPDKKLVALDNGEVFSLPEVVPHLFCHNEPLKNAYLVVKGRNPEATNCDPLSLTDDPVFIGCLDYIWYNSKTIGCSGVVDTPPQRLLKEEVGLPSTNFPSDHIYLMAKLHFL
ncbi:uncharacterized protein LOC135487716 [Lineus longissimus]|uniref:uncharacterized protein LOC135487716 n=1 Tax=Lineus longissimus TaxID=88925 RepID=UPI00315DDCEA